MTTKEKIISQQGTVTYPGEGVFTWLLEENDRASGGNYGDPQPLPFTGRLPRERIVEELCVLGPLKGRKRTSTIKVPKPRKGPRASTAQKNEMHNYSRNRFYSDAGIVTYKRAQSFFNPNPVFNHSNGGTWYPPTLGDPWSSDDDFKLINALARKIEGGTDFNATSFLMAEAGDTIRLIGDIANRLADSLRALKRGNLLVALDKLAIHDKHGKWVRHSTRRDDANWPNSPFQRAIYESQVNHYRNRYPDGRVAPWTGLTADNWLTYQLAVAPLLGDATAAAERLAFFSEVAKTRRYAVRRKLVRTSNGAPWARGPRDAGPNSGVAMAQATVLWDEHWLAHQRQLVVYVSERQADIPQLLGLNNPEIGLWNALPLSFVADWALPIGSWLEARASCSVLGQTVADTTVRREVASGLRGRAFNEGPNSFTASGYSYMGTTTRSRVEYLSVSRVIGAVEAPLPTLNPAPVQHWQRAMTGFSLIRQIAGGNLSKGQTR